MDLKILLSFKYKLPLSFVFSNAYLPTGTGPELACPNCSICHCPCFLVSLWGCTELCHSEPSVALPRQERGLVQCEKCLPFVSRLKTFLSDLQENVGRPSRAEMQDPALSSSSFCLPLTFRFVRTVLCTGNQTKSFALCWLSASKKVNGFPGLINLLQPLKEQGMRGIFSLEASSRPSPSRSCSRAFFIHDTSQCLPEAQEMEFKPSHPTQ